MSLSQVSAQQGFVANLDESKVGDIPIPNVLEDGKGNKATSREEWLGKIRPVVLQQFEQEVYGRTPGGKIEGTRYEVLAENKSALEGTAIMRQVRIHFPGKEALHADVLLYLPAKAPEGGAPVFVSLNFGGNQIADEDPSIILPDGWFRDRKTKRFANAKAAEETRGSSKDRWPVREIVKRGYGVATAYCGHFDPDFEHGFQHGVHRLFYKEDQKQPAADEWACIGGWAWGLSRMADYLETVPEVNSKKLLVVGHSRLGKAALWAGAQDERFAIVISNNSGAGGAALSKRIYGETVGRLNSSFPHWFCGNFKKYSLKEADLPVDQHQLIALMAPRPVYIASATEDTWADPKGEFLAGKLAEPVYALFDKKGLGVDEQPAPDKSVGEFIGYHNRTGKHDIQLYDWERYMDFADKHWQQAK